ncbi:MAG: hypothetical protein WAX04_12285 [Oscillospiraceae bacterium]
MYAYIYGKTTVSVGIYSGILHSDGKVKDWNFFKNGVKSSNSLQKPCRCSIYGSS